MEPDIRDEIIDYVKTIPERTGIRTKTLLKWIGISQSKYYAWRDRQGTLNQHKGKTPLLNEILPWERKAIIAYARTYLKEGYRRLTYMMLDEDIVALSPSTTYQVLKSAGLLNLKKRGKANLKKTGFFRATSCS